jgi:DNA-binding transcriptional regulator YhcF (GntR family)
MTEQYTNHPAADLFPMMQGKQWEEFKEDIRQNGFQESVTLYKNQILDGRNRYKAAIELDMIDDLPISEIDDDHQFDPFQWVISRNLHRRHLTESQRGMVAARLAKLKVGDVASQRIGVQICVPSIEKAAEQLQVSPRTVNNAKSVIEHGSPELIRAVDEGEVAVSRAATVAKTTPKEKQVEVAKEKPKQQAAKVAESKPQKEPARDLDQEAVEDFLRCRSRLSRLKKLLAELTTSELKVIEDWLATNV